MTTIRGGRAAASLPARRSPLALVAALACAGALGACHTVSDALGDNKVMPDEFRVVTKAPLVVPPEYALRPPTPGEPRPQELQPESQARAALLGERDNAARSPGEVALVDRAGAQTADPMIRYVVDDEYGELAHKTKSFADTVMFWRKGQPENAQVVAEQDAATTPNPVDPATVQKTVAALTGGKAVVIDRAPGARRIKLPGL